MLSLRLGLLAGLLMLVGCTSSDDGAAPDAESSELADATGDVSADGQVEAAEGPVMSDILVSGGASPEVADCQAQVLADAGVREVDDLATMAEAMEGLTPADQQAMVDCVNQP